jgi:hypothetical protein
MLDISGWDQYHYSHGSCKCWDGVPDDIMERALEMMRELREMTAGLEVSIEIWPLSEETRDFARKCLLHRE